jgi:hypothetical protein
MSKFQPVLCWILSTGAGVDHLDLMEGVKEMVEALSKFVETILLCCEHSPNHLYPYPLFAQPNFDIRLCLLLTVHGLTMPKALHILPMESISSATQDNLLTPPGDFMIAITPV